MKPSLSASAALANPSLPIVSTNQNIAPVPLMSGSGESDSAMIRFSAAYARSSINLDGLLFSAPQRRAYKR
jgi:hypothetical protein